VELCSSLNNLVRVSRELSEKGAFLCYTIAWLAQRRESHAIDRAVEECVKNARSRHSLETLKDDPIARAYRDFMWRLGIDPTKVRPSSEALLRRVLRGSFPRINPVVDAGNIASVETLVPIGIYDLNKFRPPLELRLSRGGEVFRGLGGKELVLERGVPILVDVDGKVMHIYPHRDSVETCVDENTSSILIVGAGVPRVPRELVEKAVRRVIELLQPLGWSWCGVVAHAG